MTNSKLGHPVKNRFKVPTKKWRKWSNHAKKIFNDMYHELRLTMQATYAHPNALPLPKDHWETLRWNVSWIAANTADGTHTLDRATNSQLHEHRGTAKSKAGKAWKRHEKKHPKKAARKSKGKRRGR